MTIDEMIERLEELRDKLGGGTEVRLATQPNYPLEYSIAGIVASTELRDEDEDEDEDEDDSNASAPVVWIAENSQLGYATKSIWRGI